MSIPPRKFREVIFQILYSYDMGYSEVDAIVNMLMRELSISKKIIQDAEKRARLVLDHLKAIDAKISETSSSYDFNRIQRIERNILRLSIFEMLYDETIPPKVAIAEAIRLARKFSTPESAHFINAILDGIYQKSIGQEVNAGEIQKASLSLKESEETAKNASEQSDAAD